MEKYKEFSDLLEIIGAKGTYQKHILYGIVVPSNIIIAILSMSSIFLFQVPNHWCLLPEIENFTQGEIIDWKNRTLPIETGPDGKERFSRCQIYDETRKIIDCPNGWEYDRNDLVETIGSDFDWVCSRDYFPSTLFTMIEVGKVVGTVIFGLLADRIGRRPVFFISLCLHMFSRVISFLIPQYFIVMVVFTFLSSVGFPMLYIVPTMVLAEMCDDELRSWTYTLMWLVYVAGAAAVPYISYFASHWYYISILTTFPGFLMFLYWFFLPESPSWLTSVGRTKEAGVILRKIALRNQTLNKFRENELDDILVNISDAQAKKNRKPNMLTLFAKARLAKHVILYTISWTASNLIYDCITLNTPNMSGDQFLNFFLLMIVEAPSCFVGGYLLAKAGRRWTGAGFFLLCSISCFIGAAFMPFPNLAIVVVIATFIAKFTINITYLVAFLQAAELLPTPLRATGVSFGATMSSVIGILVPSIVYTDNYSVVAPYLVMGGVGIFAMLTSAFIPETLHQDLPETIEAADNFGKDNPFWSLRVKLNTNAKKRRQSLAAPQVLPDVLNVIPPIESCSTKF